MKCFHFSAGGGGGRDEAAAWSRASRPPWASTGLESALGSGAMEHDSGSDSSPLLSPGGRPDGLRAFTFAELRAATKGFSRALMIGEGGFGCVYRGAVSVVPGESGAAGTMDVAVKQLNRNGSQGHKEWITEVNILGVAKHPNLVKLVGYCAEDDERGIQRLLVYELLPNKSLEDRLLVRVRSNLSWALRLRIARDAARGLAYLHEEMDFQLIFRDFKASNILLDKDFNAKLSDFGLARQGPAAGVDHVSTTIVGTVGYAAPEYIQTGRITAKCDVWSFGVVLYELITGRRAVERNRPRSEQKLLDWVKPYASDAKKLHIIVDPSLKGEYCIKSVRKLVSLANKCLMKQPRSRPKMSQVVEMLDQIIEMLEGAVGPTQVPKEKGGHRCKVFDVREMIGLRNKSAGSWRLLAPGSMGKFGKTWGYD